MDREEAIAILTETQVVYFAPNGKQKAQEALEMAIEALQDTPTESTNTSTNTPTDLISRADAIKAVCNAQCELDVPHYPQCDQLKYCDEIQALLALPSAEAEWIPCSERLPEDGQGVIICTNDKRFKDHPVGTCIYEDGGFHTNFHDDISMIAWMPLPKPYTGEDEE